MIAEAINLKSCRHFESRHDFLALAAAFELTLTLAVVLTLEVAPVVVLTSEAVVAMVLT